MSVEGGYLTVLSINHETVPMEERELYSSHDANISTLYQLLKGSDAIRESLVLSTCNRFELYTFVGNANGSENTVLDLLSEFYEMKVSTIQGHAKLRSGSDAVQHLIEVSAGLRSQITGEAEIFGQVKSAYAKCQEFGTAGKLINRVCQKGFQAAKLIRNSTPIGQGQINIANVAVDLASKIFGKLDTASALVLGTGEIGEKTTKALRSRSVSNFGIASRSLERAEDVASEWGGAPLMIDHLDTYLHEYDIVIASTVATEPIIEKKLAQTTLQKRKARPLFLIDLGMPRNINQNCEDLDNVFLYNLDDLATIAEENLAERKKAIETSMEIANQKSDLIWQNLVKRGLVLER